MPTPHEYYLSVIGKGFDEDNLYGYQCVDGWKHWCRTVIGFDISHKTVCSPTNYAHSIWDNFDSLGLGNYFDKVPSNQMVDGDWAIWSIGSKPCPYSHISMFRKDNGNGSGVFLGQNQNGNGTYTQVNISYDGIRGALRPKIYHQEQATKETSSSNNYKCNFNMYVRVGAGTGYAIKLVSQLTQNGKENATSTNPNSYAIYKAGTIFTAKEIITNSNGTWARTPSGYVCITGASGKEYCSKC